MSDRYPEDHVFYAARRLVAVVPNNTADLPEIPKALFVGNGGTLSVIAVDDTSPVTLIVVAGQLLPIRARRVRASDTTATGIVALY